MTKPALEEPRRGRTRNDAARQAKLQVILDAALDVFVEKGFAAARLDDVAARAGVAKGTIYLYVDSKEKLFEALIRSRIAAPIDALAERMRLAGPSVETALRMLFGWFRTEVLATRRRDMLRLIMSEGPRFPALAEFYHREVVSRAMEALRATLREAAARGEVRHDELVRFPHLIVAPALMSVLWSGLFDSLDPLDTEALFEAHVTLLVRAMTADAR